MNFQTFFTVLFCLVGVCFNAAHGQQSCGTTRRSSGNSALYDRRTDKRTLTIAEYNVEWLFLNASACSKPRLQCPGSCEWTTEAIALQHMNNIAAEIKKINADIMVMPEVQDCCVLADLVSRLPASMNYSHYLVSGTDSFTGQDVGVLTRIDPVTDFTREKGKVQYPIASSSCPGTAPAPKMKTISKNINARFTVENFGSFFLFGLHLLAFPDNSARCYQREAQISVAKNAIDAHLTAFPNDNVVLLGDFNDFDGVVPDIQSSKPISRVLEIAKTAGNLKNVAEFVKQSERYSAWYDRNGDCSTEAPKEFSSIDHILVSPGLAQHVSKVEFMHYPNSCAAKLSDHYPIKVTLGHKNSNTNSGVTLSIGVLVAAIALSLIYVF